MDLITAEIENETLEFAKRFPYSKSRGQFTRLQDGTARQPRRDHLEYWEVW